MSVPYGTEQRARGGWVVLAITSAWTTLPLGIPRIWLLVFSRERSLDTIVVSESTSRLVQGAVRLEALPPVEVKGKTEPVSIYKVIGTLPRRSPIVSRGERTLSPFVGREREVATLEALLAQVEAGQGQVVGIVAEAGGGKSRLLYEFRQRLQDKRVTYLEGRCLSYGSTIPYHPLIDVLRHNCGISETDSPEAIIEKVRLALHEVGMDAEESAPYLLQLLGRERGDRTPCACSRQKRSEHRTFETLQADEPQRQSAASADCRNRGSALDRPRRRRTYLASLVESLPGACHPAPDHLPSWLPSPMA